MREDKDSWLFDSQQLLIDIDKKIERKTFMPLIKPC